MLAFITGLVMRLAALRWLLKLSGLALLLPIAAILKVVGIPLLLILMIVGMPVLILLFLFGLPIFAVLFFGGIVIALFGVVLTIGLAALKIALFVVLPVWLMWKLASMVFGWGRGDDHAPPSDREPVDPVDLGTPPDLGADPAV